jgi:hypothetical protein
MEKDITLDGVKAQQRKDNEDRECEFIAWRSISSGEQLISLAGTCIEWGYLRGNVIPAAVVIPIDSNPHDYNISIIHNAVSKFGKALKALSISLDCRAFIFVAHSGCQRFDVAEMSNPSSIDAPLIFQYDKDGLVNLLEDIRRQKGLDVGHTELKIWDPKLPYRKWHRLLSKKFYMNDIDLIEFKEVANNLQVASLIDITRADIGIYVNDHYRSEIIDRYFNRDSQGNFAVALAKKINVPSVLVLYREGMTEGWMYGVQNTLKDKNWVNMSPNKITCNLNKWSGETMNKLRA